MTDPAPPTLEDLVAEVARLRALVEERSPAAPTAAAPEPVAPAPTGPIDRRAALRKAGMMAAGAVAGGAALTAVTATPAAAATLTGSGNPGVIAQGLGGDGVSASTDTATKSAVYATTSVATAYGVFSRHTAGGTALQAESTSATRTTVAIANGATGPLSGPALAVQGLTTLGGSTTIAGTPGSSSSFYLSALTVRSQQEGQRGITVEGPGGDADTTGIDTSAYRIGADLGGRRIAARLITSRDNLVLNPTTSAAPPVRNDGLFDVRGTVTQHGQDLWHCIGDGQPGTWRKVSGAGTAGAFHVLPAPARIYDSRPGTAPAVGAKTKLQPNVARTLDLKVNGSGVPAGATAALLTILLVNAASGAGNATVWAQGVAKPLANTMVWGGNAGRFTATAVSALDAEARIQVSASLATDVVVDVVGYYR